MTGDGKSNDTTHKKTRPRHMSIPPTRNIEENRRPPIVTPGCWLLSRLSRGGQSGIFLSLIDTEIISIPNRPKSPQRYVGAVLKSYDFDSNSDEIANAYHRELMILNALPKERNPLIKAWENDVKGRLLMRWIDGPSLENFCDHVRKTNKTLPLPFALLLAQDFLYDLSIIHAETSTAGQRLGVVHRDLCPQNVLVATNPEIPRSLLIIDFGIATTTCLPTNSDHVGELPSLIGLGRPSYLSPEELERRTISSTSNDIAQKADQRSDIYSAGLVIAEILLGESIRTSDMDKRPGGEPHIDLSNEAERVVQLLENKRKDLPEIFLSILRQALAYNAPDRFRDATLFHKAWMHGIHESSFSELKDPERCEKLTSRLKQYAGYLHRSEDERIVEKLNNAQQTVAK